MCVCLFVRVPSLVEVNEKHHIVPETGQSVGRWHGDDEGKHVVDEGVECLQKSTNINQFIFFFKNALIQIFSDSVFNI